MLEYFTYKKVKKHQAEKAAHAGTQTPILSKDDEEYLRRIADEGTPPLLPERPPTFLNAPEAGDSTNNDMQMVVHDPAAVPLPNETAEDIEADAEAEAESSKEHGKDKGKNKDKGKGKEKAVEKDKKASRFSIFGHGSKSKKHDDELKPTDPDMSEKEIDKEEDDLNRILDDLNLAAVNNRAFSISKESQILVSKFTIILKDLMNGVPTAYDDLVALLEDSQGTLARSYESLPSFLQKLITTLPQKLTGSLAPELLAVATEAQALAGMSGGFAPAESSSGGGLKGAAKRLLTPTSLKDLVTKPGAVAGLLKTIMNALKLRWPAFMGTNVLLSLGLFILLFVFWYCHKRGKEVRLEKEARDRPVTDEKDEGTSDNNIDDLNSNPGGHSGASQQDPPPLTATSSAAHTTPLPSIRMPETQSTSGSKTVDKRQELEHA